MLDPLNDFFGYEENAGIAPPSSVIFVADIVKRDAVINAFRVSSLYSFRARCLC